MKTFSPSIFFDLSNFKHKALFEVENVWEVIPKISDFIIKANGPKLVVIGTGTVIEEGALIRGPAIIGKNCIISHGSYIHDNVIIGDNTKVKHSAEVKNSIVLSNSRVGHFCYVGDSILGNEVNFAGGAMIANFRLDGQNIRIKHDEVNIETNLRKLGSIIGDGSKIGVNSVLNPGVILSKRSKVFPLTNVFGTHLSEEVIK